MQEKRRKKNEGKWKECMCKFEIMYMFSNIADVVSSVFSFMG